MKARSALCHLAAFFVVTAGGAGPGQPLLHAAQAKKVTTAMLPPARPLPSPHEPGNCLAAEEVKLARLINECRRTHGLPAITVSRSLTMVAQAHVRDLQWNSPDNGTDPRGLDCNLHSWSNSGQWSPACYTRDHFYRTSMWRKPEEITRGAYNDYGFEIAFGTKKFTATAMNALHGWQNNLPHNDVIIEQGPWRGFLWPAMGVGIYQGYAAVWFGRKTDPLGTVPPCEP